MMIVCLQFEPDNKFATKATGIRTKVDPISRGLRKVEVKSENS
jgi:hypothetical protein